ncbi:MAG: hypothetical protein FWH17_10465 [Oscillospiraceae bacterium]|nr:hypothetical protein [Oscillospiraceae bacterium]
MLKNKPMPKIGVDSFCYAPLIKDDPDSVPEYGETVKIPGTVSVGFTANSQTIPFHADNGVYVSAAQTGDITLTVGLADIPPEIQAAWFGSKYENGMIEDGELNAQEMAVGYRVKKANGAYRYFWLYKGVASPPSENVNTTGNTLTHQSDSITISCAMLASTGKYRRRIDSDDKNLPAGVDSKMIENNWFESPVWKVGEIEEV